jgi:hypothetical protein
MCVSAPAEIPFAGGDRFSTANPCQPTPGPGVAVAQWQIKPHRARTDEFNQVVQVEPSLLDAIVYSVALLRSGHSLGDSPGEISLSNPVHAQVLHFQRDWTTSFERNDDRYCTMCLR